MYFDYLMLALRTLYNCKLQCPGTQGTFTVITALKLSCIKLAIEHAEQVDRLHAVEVRVVVQIDLNPLVWQVLQRDVFHSVVGQVQYLELVQRWQYWTDVVPDESGIG